VIVEHDIDAPAAYDEKRRALVDLVRHLEDHERRTIVPATPAWTVQDVLAHVVGIAADLNAQRFDGDPDAWTAHQVESRRGRSIDELAEEWDREAPRFVEGLRLFGYELASHYVGDLLQHTADVRHALGRGPLDEDDALTAALDFYLDSCHQALVTAGAGAVRVDVGDLHDLLLGPPGGPVVAHLGGVGTFELFRALGGRRSRRQVQALPWQGDVTPVLAHLSAYPWPRDDLVEGAGRPHG
jgi:hypothetical protein